jgi:hypothetical protein
MMLSTAHPAFSQARSMGTDFREDELTSSDEKLRQVQQEQPRLFRQILKDVNTDAQARDPASVGELATASPALEDLQRTSPEALLGLFLLLKGAGKKAPPPPAQ